jgi:UDP-N-acetylmuramate--alanine ligase
VTGSALTEKIQSYGHRSAHYTPSMTEGIDAIVAAAQPGDLIITLGAGSVSQAGDKIIEKLRGGV